MRRVAALVVVGLIVSLATAAFVPAITFGENDNGRHPFVGALVGELQGDKFQLCSGTLVSPTVFVTADRCLFGLEESGITGVWVTFDDVIDADEDGIVDPGVTLRTGTGHVVPRARNPHLLEALDVAVFVLDTPVTMANYGQLPTAALLDTVNKLTARFTTVGYGTVRDDKTKSFQSIGLGTRRKLTTQEMEALTGAWVQFSQNPSTDNGGTCYGDPGGPHFLGAGASETRIIVSVTVTGDIFCRATDKTYRLDTPQARSFLDDFVTLP